MKINKDSLSDLFGTEVVSHGELPTGFGLRVELADLRDLGKPFVSRFERGRIHHAAPALWELTQQVGVLVVENARMSVPANTVSTGDPSKGGLTKQDFFHRDTEPDGALIGSATVLHKPKTSASREKPTLYVKADAVRRVIGQLDIDSIDFSSNSLKAIARSFLGKMSTDQYGFSILPEDQAERSFVNLALPGLTAHLRAALPESDVYAHHWEKGRQSVVFHINTRECDILHGREHGKDAPDPLSSLVFWPT